MIGQTFGRWTALKYVGVNKRRYRIYQCQCSCKAKTVRDVPGTRLRNNKSKSCGCLHKEIVSKNMENNKYGKGNKYRRLNLINTNHNYLHVESIHSRFIRVYKRHGFKAAQHNLQKILAIIS